MGDEKRNRGTIIGVLSAIVGGAVLLVGRRVGVLVETIFRWGDGGFVGVSAPRGGGESYPRPALDVAKPPVLETERT